MISIDDSEFEQYDLDTCKLINQINDQVVIIGMYKRTDSLIEWLDEILALLNDDSENRSYRRMVYPYDTNIVCVSYIQHVIESPQDDLRNDSDSDVIEYDEYGFEVSESGDSLVQHLESMQDECY